MLLYKIIKDNLNKRTRYLSDLQVLDFHHDDSIYTGWSLHWVLKLCIEVVLRLQGAK